MPSRARPGIVQWIDHYVVCTNNLTRWELFNAGLLGAKRAAEFPIGIFQSVGTIRYGGFIAKTPLPPTKGLLEGLPRYGYYIYAGDIDGHLRRLKSVGAIHSAPRRTSSLGESGTSIRWQDPDGNQFEFWAPDVMPAGAMERCGPEQIGRISHAVLESRDLDRTAAFFKKYCALERLSTSGVSDDLLVLPLAAGGKLAFQRVSALQGRNTGCGLPDAHTALLVHDDDYFSSYQRLWTDLPEAAEDVVAGRVSSDPEQFAPCTLLHPSQGGREFKKLTGRGDDWFDWDGNLFHFFGGKPKGDSLAVYEGQAIQDYIMRWQDASGDIKQLVEVTQR